MIKKAITYTDYNGVERTEDHWFHLNETELMRLQMSAKGGLDVILKGLIAAQDGAAIIATIEDVVQKAYGVRGLDGRQFIKNETVRNEFFQTEAYSQLIMELVTDSEKAAEFVKGIMPAKIQEEAAKIDPDTLLAMN